MQQPAQAHLRLHRHRNVAGTATSHVQAADVVDGDPTGLDCASVYRVSTKRPSSNHTDEIDVIVALPLGACKVGDPTHVSYVQGRKMCQCPA